MSVNNACVQITIIVFSVLVLIHPITAFGSVSSTAQELFLNCFQMCHEPIAVPCGHWRKTVIVTKSSYCT